MKDKLFDVTVDDLTFYPYPKNIQDRLDTLREKNVKATEKYISSQRSIFSFIFVIVKLHIHIYDA